MAKKNNSETEQLEAATPPETPEQTPPETPPEPPPSDGDKPGNAGGEAPPATQTENKISVTLRHKTEYPQYRRAGIVLKQTPGEFSVTAEQLAVLEKDTWVEVVKK
jgi:hypothetical protein